jgi:hypothetical protein
MDSPAGTLNSTGIKKRTSRNSIVKNGTLSSTGKSPSPNKSHLKPNGDVSLTRPKSPSFEPILSIEENSIPTSNNDLTEIANEEPALPSTMRNSLRKKSKFGCIISMVVCIMRLLIAIYLSSLFINFTFFKCWIQAELYNVSNLLCILRILDRKYSKYFSE